MNDLAATDVDKVNVDLGAPDGAADQVIANGTAGNDAVSVSGDGSGGVVVTGLAAIIAVLHPEPTDQVVVNGLAGSNRLDVNGTAGNDTLSLSGDATAITVAGLPAQVRMPAPAASDQLFVNGLGGNDQINGAGLQAQPAALTLDGGTGDDGIAGSQGFETTLGGDGNDFADGNRGNDFASMGAGDDTFQWDPGDGNDTIEGDAGNDTMLFNGANIAEKIDLSANGNRLRFTRDIANIVMDTDNVEQVDVQRPRRRRSRHRPRPRGHRRDEGERRPLGGARRRGRPGDRRRHARRRRRQRHRHRAASRPSTASPPRSRCANAEAAQDRLVVDTLAGDDRITVAGTEGNDTIGLAGDATGLLVTGLPAIVSIPTTAADQAFVNGLGGNDQINGAGQAAQAAGLRIDGGPGDDTLNGTRGVETLLGGDGNDFADGNQGNDFAQLGAGDDTFQWDPGDGSDTINGDTGNDTMLFNGANIAERFELTANGSFLRFTRDIGTIVMDTRAVEHVDVRALGGADVTTVNDLTGTDVTKVEHRQRRERRRRGSGRRERHGRSRHRPRRRQRGRLHGDRPGGGHRRRALRADRPAPRQRSRGRRRPRGHRPCGRGRGAHARRRRRIRRRHRRRGQRHAARRRRRRHAHRRPGSRRPRRRPRQQCPDPGLTPGHTRSAKGLRLAAGALSTRTDDAGNCRIRAVPSCGGQMVKRTELPTGTVTFLCSRLADGESSAARREQHEQAVAAVLGEHGGVEVERGNGSVLGVFASSGAAVAAAIDLIGGSPQGSGVRVALHTGEATPGVNGYPGPAGEHAVRVGAAAAEGQVLLTSPTAALVEHGLSPGERIESLGSRVLPGLDRPETLFELRLGISSTPVHARDRPFLERDGELAAVLALAERARDGDGSLVVIEGSAGIGKTRLLAEARRCSATTCACSRRAAASSRASSPSASSASSSRRCSRRRRRACGPSCSPVRPRSRSRSSTRARSRMLPRRPRPRSPCSTVSTGSPPTWPPTCRRCS